MEEFLPYNVDNMFKNLLQAEYHAKAIRDKIIEPAHLSCIHKHLAFIEAEVEEATGHCLVEKPETCDFFQKLLPKVQKVRDKIRKGRVGPEIQEDIRALRKDVEKEFTEYDTSQCKVCGILEESSSTPNEFKRGECYRNSYLKAKEIDGTVVHGTVFAPHLGKIIDHAWVEKGEMVYDPTIDVELPKREYYHRLEAKKSVTYTVEEASKRLLREKHWGPWNSERGADLKQAKIEGGSMEAKEKEDFGKQSHHFKESHDLDIIVFPNDVMNEIWIRNAKEYGGIYGTIRIKTSAGPGGFGIEIMNAAGDVPLSVVIGEHKFCKEWLAVHELNQEYMEKGGFMPGEAMDPVPVEEIEELQAHGIVVAPHPICLMAAEAKGKSPAEATKECLEEGKVHPISFLAGKLKLAEKR